MTLVVCFSGRIGSGKTSVSRNVASSLVAAWVGFGDFFRDVATKRGLDTNSRKVLQDLGSELIQAHGVGWLCEQVLSRASLDGRQPLVIDGVRHVDVLDAIAAQLAKHRIVLIHLDLDESIAREGALEANVRKEIELHSTERDVRQALPARADLLVSTDVPLEEVIGAVLAYIRPLVES